MKYTVRFLSFAQEDKRNILIYLRQFYPSTPGKFSAALKAGISTLKDNPYQYPLYPDYPAYRRMIVGNYLVFYRVNDEALIVEVHRILRGSWDIPHHLGEGR
jgi:plasmid stabilization system protein ParE